MWGLSRRKLWRAALILGLAESPVALQLLDLDRSYLFFAFGLAWAVALYGLVEPKPRAVAIGLLVYIATAVTAVPLLLLWLNHVPSWQGTGGRLERHFIGSFGVGVREELSKAVTLLCVLWIGSRLRPRFSAREGLIYGAMAGLAFAAVENLEAFRKLCHVEDVALAHGLDATMAWTVAAALGRLVSTPLAHACWSATVGFAFTAPNRTRMRRLWLGTGALTLCAGLHGLYDTCASLGNRVGLGALLAFSFGLLIFLVSRAEQLEEEVAPPRERILFVPAPLGIARLALPIALGLALLAVAGWSIVRLMS